MSGDRLNPKVLYPKPLQAATRLVPSSGRPGKLQLDKGGHHEQRYYLLLIVIAIVVCLLLLFLLLLLLCFCVFIVIMFIAVGRTGSFLR